ncbi:hypothetical protein RBU60_14095 [Mesonia sp. MT50]|uniref:DNA primase n=1 Tax=Mesonia profundi TaxID=3070998 RepID=A0ABU1A6R1_9FLAO|nr:hypothetical protein [Mesonia profundi]MDQ7918701.1 hypothetical protein [Mesonia profundi]
MKRVIVDYKKLTPEILGLLVEKYPDGYDDDHIITFKNAKNETIEAVEVKTEDCIYLVKVSTRLENTMANYEEDDYEDEDLNEPIEEINANDKKLLKEDLDNDAEEDDEDDDKEEE